MTARCPHCDDPHPGVLTGPAGAVSWCCNEARQDARIANLEAENDRLREALREAATSLDTISHAGSRYPKSDLETFSDIRGYSASRARVAREALGEVEG